MSPPLVCFHCFVSDKPILPEAFRSIPLQHSDAENTIIKVNISIRFALRSNSGRVRIIRNLSQLSSHYISYTQFFEDGQAFLRSKLSHQLLRSQSIDKLIPSIMSNSRRLFKDRPRLSSNVEDVYVEYPLFVDVIANFSESEQVIAAIERFMWESMQQDRMIPASEEAIKWLNTFKFEENVAGDDTQQNQCCICFQDFEDGVEVSTMPCQHIYHNDCIVRWLKTSHLCPLCRYSMPVAHIS